MKATISSEQFADILIEISGCSEAAEWAKGKTPEEAWSACERGDWMLWIAAKSGVERKLIVMQACKAARRALKYVPKGEDRPLAAIECAEAWCRGEATIEEVRSAAPAAADAAYDAYAAADAAACAACAAYAADAAADAADAAEYAAACAAAYAACAAASVASPARQAIRLQEFKEIADDVRVGIPFEIVTEALTRFCSAKGGAA